MAKRTEEVRLEQKKGFFLVYVDKEIRVDFELLRRHIETTEKFAEEQEKKIEDNGNQEYDSFSQARLGDHSYGHHEFVRTLRNNAFVSAVSLLEAHFRMLVDYLPKKPKLEVEELSGDSLRKPFIYLTSVLGYDLSVVEKGLKELMRYYKFRNRIVHHLGSISIDKSVDDHHQNDLFRFLKAFDSIEIWGNGRVTITGKTFTEDFINKAERFLIDCHKVLADDYLGKPKT